MSQVKGPKKGTRHLSNSEWEEIATWIANLDHVPSWAEVREHVALELGLDRSESSLRRRKELQDAVRKHKKSLCEATEGLHGLRARLAKVKKENQQLRAQLVELKEENGRLVRITLEMIDAMRRSNVPFSPSRDASEPDST